MTYRVGNHQPQNLYRGDQYIGVFFDPIDTRHIVNVLNPHAPDVTYLHGVRDALGDVRRRLDSLRTPFVTITAIWQLLEAAAAELGIDKDAPKSPPSAPVSDQQPQTQGQVWAEVLTALSGRFCVYAVPYPMALGITHDSCPSHWFAEIDEPAGLDELVQRAAEHAEVCK